MTDPFLVVVALLAIASVALQIVAILRRQPGVSQDALERVARDLRADIGQGHKEARESGQAQRTELSGGLNQFSRTLQQQMAAIAGVHNNQIDSFGQQLAKLVQSNEQRLTE